MGLNLLNKTEVWVNKIKLNNANLTQMAESFAAVLQLRKENVLVVDVRPHSITFDILENDIPLDNIIGKEAAILNALSSIKGVNITKETYIHSDGILGMICLQEEDAELMVANIAKMGKDISENVAKRVLVFPTGFELTQKMIEDTNSPYLKEIFEKEGYTVTIGPVIEDDIDVAVYRLSDALSRGFGLIITTGGVGAEDKDKSVEALLKVDPQAATEYIAKFKKGTGRHVKDGVRIGVGEIGPSLIVTLPGPNDEVRLAGPVLCECLQGKKSKEEIAKKLAAILARKLMKTQHEFHYL